MENNGLKNLTNALATLHRIEDKDQGTRLRFNEHAVEIGFGFVLVGKKPEQCYVDYVIGSFDRGVKVVHLFATAEARIAKAQRVAQEVVNSGSGNVYRFGIVRDKFEDGRVLPSLALTLASSDVLPMTNESAWTPEDVRTAEIEADEAIRRESARRSLAQAPGKVSDEI